MKRSLKLVKERWQGRTCYVGGYSGQRIKICETSGGWEISEPAAPGTFWSVQEAFRKAKQFVSGGKSMNQKQIDAITGKIVKGLKADIPDEVLDEISKETVQEYEECRELGPCNMFDRNCVARFASDNRMYDLAGVASDRRAYAVLVKHYSTLMRHYGVRRGYTSGRRRRTELVSRFQ